MGRIFGHWPVSRVTWGDADVPSRTARVISSSTPDGSIDRRIATRSEWPMSIADGGGSLGTLFITTMLPYFGTPPTNSQ